MKTIQIEKESFHVRMMCKDGKERPFWPYVAEMRLTGSGKDTKVVKKYLKTTTREFLTPKDTPPEEARSNLTWDAPQWVPLSIGTCVNSTTFDEALGMFEDGEWKEMTFSDVRKHLAAEAARDENTKKTKSKKPNEDSIAEDPFGVNS